MPGANEETKNEPGAQDDQDQNQGDQGSNKGGGKDQQTQDKDTGFKTLEEANSYIKNLRTENANHRTKNKELTSKFSAMEGTLSKLKQALGGEDGEEIDPAEALGAYQAENEALKTDKALTDLALENDIPPKQTKYFKYLVAERLSELEEGEELDEEALAEIMQEVRGLDAKKKGKTGTGLNDDHRPSDDGNGGDPTAEDFGNMDMNARNSLYVKNPPLYTKLFNEAKAKGLLHKK